MEECCNVCRLDEAHEDDLIIYCDGCDIGVHQGCYGVTTVPDGDWYCNRCRQNALKERCALCPSSFGAMKPTTCGKWAHVVCSLYCSNVQFVDEQTMEPILLPAIDTPMTMACYICMESKNSHNARIGQTIICNHPGCTRAFHVTCGQEHNLLREENFESSFYNGYCKAHIGQHTQAVEKKTGDMNAQRKKRKRAEGPEGEVRGHPQEPQPSGRKRVFIDGDDAIFALASDLPTMKPSRNDSSDESDESYLDDDIANGHAEKRVKLKHEVRRKSEEDDKRIVKKMPKKEPVAEPDPGSFPTASCGLPQRSKQQEGAASRHRTPGDKVEGNAHGQPQKDANWSAGGSASNHHQKRSHGDGHGHSDRKKLGNVSETAPKVSRRGSSATKSSEASAVGEKKRSHKKGGGVRNKDPNENIYGLLRQYTVKEEPVTFDDTKTLKSFIEYQHAATKDFATELYQQALVDHLIDRVDAVEALHNTVTELEESYEKLKAKSEKMEATIKRQTFKKAKYQTQREEAGVGSKELIYKIKVTAFHVLQSCANLAKDGSELDLRSFQDYWKIALQVCEGHEKEKKMKRAKAMRQLGKQLCNFSKDG